MAASDISDSMANEGRQRAIAALGKGTANARCTFKTSDLEELTGKYDTVTCVDVMIHYPSDKVRRWGSVCSDGMVGVLSTDR